MIWLELGLVCLEIAVSVEGVILVLPSSHTHAKMKVVLKKLEIFFRAVHACCLSGLN